MEKRLYRDELNQKVGGVCAGLAEYLNVDVNAVRAIFAVGIFLKGLSVIPYIVLWIVLPKKNPFNTPGGINVDYTVPPESAYNPFSDANNPFASGPNAGAPFAMPAKKRSSAGLIVGSALVLFGTFFLLNQFDLLPDFDFSRLWPVSIILAGLMVIFSGREKPWQKKDWHKTEPKEEPVFTEEKPADESNPTA